MVVLFPGTSFDVNCENQFMRKYNFLLQSFKIKNDLEISTHCGYLFHFLTCSVRVTGMEPPSRVRSGSTP